MRRKEDGSESVRVKSYRNVDSSKLRNTAICRLLIVLSVFLAYGALSLYYNYFFHDYNRTITAQLYVLHKRGINVPIVSSLLREAVSTGKKEYLIRNPRKLAIHA